MRVSNFWNENGARGPVGYQPTTVREHRRCCARRAMRAWCAQVTRRSPYFARAGKSRKRGPSHNDMGAAHGNNKQAGRLVILSGIARRDKVRCARRTRRRARHLMLFVRVINHLKRCRVFLPQLLFTAF